MRRWKAIQEVEMALDKALSKHPQPMHGPHDGYAVILEELDELWDEVKKQSGGRNEAAMKEAAHVAAMAIRYLMDVITIEVI